MTGWLKRIRITKFISLILLTLIFVGCEEEKEKKVEKIVVQVGDSKLTENRLERLLSFDQYANRYEEEIINEWIESELLFLAASDDGILEDSLYKMLSRESNKKLAGTLYLKKYYSTTHFGLDGQEIEKYYELHNSEFALNEEAYVYNLVKLDVESFFTSSDGYTIFNESNDAAYDSLNIVRHFNRRSEIYPANILTALDTLEAGKISIIPNTEPGVVSIVQLKRRLGKGEIPSYRLIEELVADRYYDYQRMILYDKLINDLYSQYDVIISR